MSRGEPDRRLVVLPRIDACGESWDAMEGDEHVRRCSSCDKDVHDLSALTSDEAAEFLAGRRGDLPCLRVAEDAEGRPLFRDDLARIARRLAAFGAAASLAACNNVTPAAGEPTPETASAAPTASGMAPASSSPHGPDVNRTLGAPMPADAPPPGDAKKGAGAAASSGKAIPTASSGAAPPTATATPKAGGMTSGPPQVRKLTGKPGPSPDRM